MKFDIAIQALGSAAWDWSEEGFALVAATLGFEREADADAEMPVYMSPWGKEWVQAIVEDGHVDRVELLVEDTAPRWRPFTAKKLEALERKYRTKHGAYTTRATRVLGDPTFVGEPGAAGFPNDEDAHLITMWKRDGTRIMLISRNEGPDTPFWISIVVKPAIMRAPTSRASKPAMRPPTRSSSTVLNGTRFATAVETIRTTRWEWSRPVLETIVENLPFAASVDDERVELAIESSAPPSPGFIGDDHTDLDREYMSKYELYVERAQQILGRPKFNDGMAHKGYPKDEPGEMLALWGLKTARVMVVYRAASDDHSPYTLSLVVKPR